MTLGITYHTVQIWPNEETVPYAALAHNLCSWFAVVDGKVWAYFDTKQSAEAACIAAGF